MRRQLILTLAGFLLVVSSPAWAERNGSAGEGGNTGVHGAGSGGGIGPSRPSRRGAANGHGGCSYTCGGDHFGGDPGAASGGAFGGIGIGGTH